MADSALLNVMIGVALKAGKGLLRDFGEVDHLQISRKGTSNFVTNADIRTEKLIRKELEKARPDYGFLLEEGGEVKGHDETHRWIIDPLDGTNNFIHAMPHFCVSIALEKRFNGKSEILAGVIYDPIHNELFSAERGKGAMINQRRLTVSTRKALDDSMLVMGNPRHAAEPAQKALFTTLAQRGSTIRYFGATALDLAHVAAGRIDACWFYSAQPWDVAAGMLLVQEAGGIVTSLDGRSVDAYAGSMLASNPHLHAELSRGLAKA